MVAGITPPSETTTKASVKVKTVEVKPVQKVTTIRRPIQTTTIKRPVQTTTIKRPMVTKMKIKTKPKMTGPPFCEWRGEKESGRWVCNVDWPNMGWYEDVLEAEENLFPNLARDELPEWTERDCDALPMEQMMRCTTMNREMQMQNMEY